MNLDEAYQQAVDEQAQCLLHTEAPALRALPPSGIFEVGVAGRTIRGTWDHLLLPDGIHWIAYRLDRTSWLSLSQYFNGVKVLPNDKVQLLTVQEIGLLEL
ncbi:hypothetical protein GCM10023185_27250 [Hymenobacter saemangeumensis]|uniref:Uncharacterized protein n=1 Tax=Hymenobacter saemangeumensis TaxID=1084522 RepID=A0ABP8IJB7_9BACT